ncbi:MAG: DUF2127 domain-containing protein [Verrucomicrobia bacterium]|nr:DUF2127 domain-containing protein [Verrucomicrobiota bacterium]
MSLRRWSLGLRAIAIFELIKGGAVLVAFIMVASGHWTMPSLMERITHYLHLKQDGPIGQFFNGTIAHLEPGVLVWLAFAYMAVRFTEAYGLWRERHWGEWLAVFSSGLYVPAEIYELFLHFSMRKVGVLMVNVIIIAFLGWVLWNTRSGMRSRNASD